MGEVNEISNLVKLYNEEFNFIFLNLGVDKYGISPLIKSIKSTEDNLVDTIKNNSFRLDGVVVYIPYKSNDFSKIWENLKQFDNLYIFVICQIGYKLDVIPYDNVVFRQIYTLKDNPKWFNQINFNGPPFYPQQIPDVDRYIFLNILNEEEFTLESNKLSYIRDKKIDIFLDNSKDI